MAHFLALLFRYWHQQSSDKGCTQCYAGNALRNPIALPKFPKIRPKNVVLSDFPGSLNVARK